MGVFLDNILSKEYVKIWREKIVIKAIEYKMARNDFFVIRSSIFLNEIAIRMKVINATDAKVR